MVMTAPKNFERVKAVLLELDRDILQVLIKVLIAEVTHDNSRDLGAEFSVLGKPFPSRSASMRVRAYGGPEFTRGPGTPRFAGA